ncbi:hypothetical protein C0585_00945 [Candidatus Woesearchaeota archaeon]|nr:MAG: hypothetical protein C0585_00945 [Candidatus Woesearchaeota archaeon]
MAWQGMAGLGKAKQGSYPLIFKRNSYSLGQAGRGMAWRGQARPGKAKQGVWQNYKLPFIYYSSSSGDKKVAFNKSLLSFGAN